MNDNKLEQENEEKEIKNYWKIIQNYLQISKIIIK